MGIGSHGIFAKRRIKELKDYCSPEPLKKIKKENLAKVAAHYRITVAAGAKRSHILDLIEDHCVENDINDEVEENPTAETAKFLRIN